MKNIKISKKQKEKLLEMASNLFPEIKYWEFGVSNKICGGWSINFVCADLWNAECIICHWYEFVNTQLAEKILNPTPNKPERNLKEKFCDFFWNNNLWWSSLQKDDNFYFPQTYHPVEYLYNIYKSK